MTTGWMQKTLGEAGEWLSGGTPSKTQPGFWSGSIPWVSPKDMKVSRIQSAIDRVSEEAIGNGTRIVPPDTILVVVRGMILAHSFPVALTTASVAFNQDIKALRPVGDFDPEFILCTGCRAIHLRSCGTLMLRIMAPSGLLLRDYLCSP